MNSGVFYIRRIKKRKIGVAGILLNERMAVDCCDSVGCLLAIDFQMKRL